MILFEKAQAISFNLPNPLGGIQSIPQLLELIGRFLFEIGLVLGVISFLIAALLFMTSMGEEKRIERAKQAIFWGVIGIVLVLIGLGITNTIKSFLGS